MSVYLSLRFEYGQFTSCETKLNGSLPFEKLAAIAKRRRVAPISAFLAAEKKAENDLAPLQEDIGEKEFASGEIDGKEGDRRNRLLKKLACVHGRWYTADEGLRTIDALLAASRYKPHDPKDPTDNLLELRGGLEAAKKKGRRFRMYMG